MARLIFATAKGQQAFELRPMNTLGRHPNNSIQLLDKIVAKEHCVLERRAGILILRDLGSLNGTYVNGERVRGERALAHGDEIALGATRARYHDGFGPMNFAPPAVSAGAVEQPPPGDWQPPGGGGSEGSGGASPAMSPGAVQQPAPPRRQRPE